MFRWAIEGKLGRRAATEGTEQTFESGIQVNR
jgi:hypothetical protein